MTRHSRLPATDSETLTRSIADQNRVSEAMVRLFTDFTPFTAELLKNYYLPGGRLFSIGHIHPAVEMAADRADLQVTEILSETPFGSDCEHPADSMVQVEDMLYMSNPNRVTGVGHTLKQIERLANSLRYTVLLIDEAHFDYFGITAVPLVEKYRNLIVLRSFKDAPGNASTDAGYAVSHQSPTRILHELFEPITFSREMHRAVRISTVKDDTFSANLKATHTETLRVTRELSQLGVQIQLGSADFFLLRVADPKEVGNHLASWQVSIENLNGYPKLNNYVKYTVRSEETNDRLLAAFKKMPQELYRLKDTDRREVTLRRSGEESETTTVDRLNASRLKETVEMV